MNIELPGDVQCAVALSYDLEMCAGYSPSMVNHGHIIPDLQKYTLTLCDIAESYDVILHFFYVTNGLEAENIDYLKEIINRGHVIDSHTYSHVSLATDDEELLDSELKKANQLLAEKLGIKSKVLRGPGGIINGLNDYPVAQKVILENGFRYVSSAYKDPLTHNGFHYINSDYKRSLTDKDLQNAAQLTTFDPPYRYQSGLIEIPMHGLTDRNWFDMHYCIRPDEFNEWRRVKGHQPVATDWCAPWTAPDALDKWIQYNLDLLDRVYQEKALWVPVWHPYTHYLHDRQNIALKSLLEFSVSKPKKVWICTLRDVINMLRS